MSFWGAAHLGYIIVYVHTLAFSSSSSRLFFLRREADYETNYQIAGVRPEVAQIQSIELRFAPNPPL